MAGFNGLMLTKQGIDLQLKVQAGNTKLKFTRIAIGDGTIQQGYNLEDLTSLINERLSLQIDQIEIISPEHVKIKTSFNNFEFEEGMYVRELGLFAKEEGGTEILFSIGNSGEKADYIPSAGDDVVEEILSIITTVGNSSSVINKIDESLLFVTKKGIEEVIGNHNINTETHPDIREQINTLSNPSLLINGNFRVNQRGLSEYIGSVYQYTLDRWAVNNSRSKVLVNDGFVRVENYDSQYATLGQTIELTNKAISGKKITISFWIKDFDGDANQNMVRAYFTTNVSSSISSKIYDKSKPICKGYNEFTIDVPEGDFKALTVYVYTGRAGIGGTATTFFELEWMKVEIGEYATPFSPRSYAEELAMCQRYYEVMEEYSIWGSSINTNGLCQVGGTFKVTKRIVPTMMSKNELEIHYMGQGSVRTGDASTLRNTIDCCRFDITPKSDTVTTVVGRPVVVQQPIHFDAEIY